MTNNSGVPSPNITTIPSFLDLVYNISITYKKQSMQHSTKFLQRTKQLLTASVLFFHIALLVTGFKSTALAQYDNGAYGRCSYNEECDDNTQPSGGTNYRGSGGDNNSATQRRRDPGEATKVMEPIHTPGLNALNPAINWINEMPDAKKQQLPFYGWILLIILALILTIQALIDRHKTNQLLILTDKLKKTLDDQKSFIRLVSHHLNTPLATSKNSLEMLENIKPPEPQAVNALRPAVSNLASTVNYVTNEVANNSDSVTLANFSNQSSVSFRNTITKWYFLLPITLAIIGGLFLNFLISRIGIDNKSVYFTFQIVSGIMAIIIFANILRMIRTSRQKYKITQNINKATSELTEKRSQVIQSIGTSLQTTSSNINNGSQLINNQQIKNLMTNGTSVLGRLSSVIKSLFSPIAPATSVSLQSIVASVIAKNQINIQAKNINLSTDLQVKPTTSIYAPEFTFIFNSMLENAVEYCDNNGNIGIRIEQNNNFIDVSITDDGSGIDPTKASSLFQPFSTGGDVLTYDHDGLGLSLYAGKQLLDKVGGKVSIASKPSQGTTASFIMPTA